MIVDILFSGSRGNCTFVRSRRTAILIDCGKSARAVTTALSELGCSISDISGVFITHEHSDHTSALDVICAKNSVPVHVTSKSAPRLKAQEHTAENLVIHETEYEVSVGDLTIRSFPLPHDSANHVGYVISDSDGDTFGVATDMGHITDTCVENLSACRRVMIESNHDVEMLKVGPYPAELKRRILSPRGHLSNESCAELACTLAKNGCMAFALAHLSPENNDPDIAFCETRRALDAAGFEDRALVTADRVYTVHLPDVNEMS